MMKVNFVADQQCVLRTPTRWISGGLNPNPLTIPIYNLGHMASAFTPV